VALYKQGYIVTLYDAVRGAQQIEIVDSTGKYLPATAVGAIPQINLAVISTDAAVLPVSDIAQYGPHMGDSLYAVGGADENTRGSLGVCYVAHPNRTLETKISDSEIWSVSTLQIGGLEGDSWGGAPLFDSRGALVAIAISTQERVLAIPCAKIWSIIQAISAGQSVGQDMLSSVATRQARLGVSVEQVGESGIYGMKIVGFSEDATDARDKLRVGDIIVGIGESVVVDSYTQTAALSKFSSGQTAEIFVIRGGQRLSFLVRLM
jgi:serine protease Do